MKPKTLPGLTTELVQCCNCEHATVSEKYKGLTVCFKTSFTRNPMKQRVCLYYEQKKAQP